MTVRLRLLISVCLTLVLMPVDAVFAVDTLEDDLGRNDVRVKSAAFPLIAGSTVHDLQLDRRLERQGYVRVRSRPTAPGEFFWGHEAFWIYRRAHRYGGRAHAASLIGLSLQREDSLILGAVKANGDSHPLERAGLLWLEPETLSESLAADRATRRMVDIDALPDHVWQTLLAAEDARFFKHSGVDGRSLARAALANAKKGGVVQGGSTITQQLIKNRDMTPKRSLGRKASEAMRALSLEAKYDKREILEAYLNQVYYGNVDGLAVHGIGTASRTFFGRSAAQLDLAQSATLAAVIQGPNRLSPLRHPQDVRERRDWVLTRMAELEWATPAAVARAKAQDVRTDFVAPSWDGPGWFLSHVAGVVDSEAPIRSNKGRGFVVETSLDPLLQQLAEDAVENHLQRLRRDYRLLRGTSLSAALVALDATTGAVLAWVGGDPGDSDAFDRVARARRQPGSTVKPFVLLEAFDRCGNGPPLHTATRVADEPLTIDLTGDVWVPENADEKFFGVIDTRTALAQSRNVPLIRLARHCGFEATAQRFARAGLTLPSPLPPSFAIGAVETSPLELARAYTMLATPGRRLEPMPVMRIERPDGAGLFRARTKSTRVARKGSAWLVRHVMTSAVAEGTATGGQLAGLDVAAKTGTSNERRDAWFAGHAGSVVTVVWVGLDDGGRLGLTGATGAAPIWREFMQAAVRARPQAELQRPAVIVDEWIDPRSGLRVRPQNPRARREVFRGRIVPPRARFWRIDKSPPVIR